MNVVFSGMNFVYLVCFASLASLLEERPWTDVWNTNARLVATPTRTVYLFLSESTWSRARPSPPHLSILVYNFLTSRLSSPWTDKYELAEHNRYAEPVCSFIAGRLSQLKSEVVVYSREEYCTLESRMPHPQCSLGEVQRKRKGVVADVEIGGDELVIEYKVSVCVCVCVCVRGSV